jgi:subtilase family protein
VGRRLSKSAHSLPPPKGIIELMRGHKYFSGIFYRSRQSLNAHSVSSFGEPVYALKIRRQGAVWTALAAGVYFGTIGFSWGDPAPVAVNLDSALQKLALHAKQAMPEAQVAGVHAQIAKLNALDKAQTPGRWDANDRVLVHIHLNGQAALDQVAKQVQSLQGQVLDRNESYQHGILAAYVPTDQLENLAGLAGVRALTMEHRPEVRVGKYTSQSSAILQTDKLNRLGLKGEGITVGVISDSFNTAYQVSPPPATTAAQDVATGDLPVVNVLQDYPGGTDEGRAICQIIYDEAPRSGLAFATADVSEVGFANNIVALRTQAGCSVIDDDVGYYDEPVFSDGLVAQAVNTVVNSTTLPGKPVIYTSSAGNDGNNGYRNYYRNLTDKEVRSSGKHGNLKFVSDPSSPNYLDPALTAGGWYNWSPYGGSEPVTTVSAPGPSSYQYALFLQWDDLFDQDHGITTSYNFLVFDQDGNYHPELSSTTNAFAVQQPIQAIGYLDLGVNYQIAITKTTQTDPKAGKIPFTHQLAIYSTLDGLSNLTGKYFNPNPPPVPNIYGHPAAASAIAVAAYDFNWKPAPPYEPQLENFTSPGPVTIYFDANGKRLAFPETRLKPEVAGVDGVITTFFGYPYYNYPFAFFGTSAAAPTVAGVVALMLQATGGPGSLDVDTVKAALENSAQPRTSTPEMSQGLGANSSGFVAVTALGQTYFGTDYLTVNYFGVPGQSIQSLTIDGAGAGLVFDTTAFTIGTAAGLKASDVQITPLSTSVSKFTLTFKSGAFTSGTLLSFTLGQDVAGTYPGYTAHEFGAGSDAESLGSGGKFSVEFGGKSKNKLSAAILNGPPMLGYSPFDGYGLINAVQAVEQIIPSSSVKK